jgi:hypothetical protein
MKPDFLEKIKRSAQPVPKPLLKALLGRLRVLREQSHSARKLRHEVTHEHHVANFYWQDLDTLLKPTLEINHTSNITQMRATVAASFRALSQAANELTEFARQPVIQAWHPRWYMLNAQS